QSQRPVRTVFASLQHARQDGNFPIDPFQTAKNDRIRFNQPFFSSLLGLYFWGGAWTLAAWCDTRQDFRNFRLDRMTDVRILAEGFPVDASKSLQAFVQKMRNRTMSSVSQSPAASRGVVGRSSGL
ncbi:MAG TPA: WYL domain-containing protein, partial [Terriglobales bacterium]|nr:WYL domain-containing protein [Terriglobales bacterium]